MPSSYTTRIRLEKQADGENANTWGLKLNQNVIDLVDEGIAGYETIALSGATSLTAVNGTTDQSRNFGLKFTGTLSADTTVTIPAQEKIYFVRNDTSGDYNLLFKNAGGTAVTGPSQQLGAILATDGTSVTTMLEADPALFASVSALTATSAALQSDIDANSTAIAAVSALVSTVSATMATSIASVRTEIPTVNNTQITLAAGTGLSGGGSFNLNQSGTETITFNTSGGTGGTLTTATLPSALDNVTSANMGDFFVKTVNNNVFIGNKNDGNEFSIQVNYDGSLVTPIRIEPGGRRIIHATANFDPTLTNVYDMGSTTLYWDEIYADNFNNQSDSRYKTSIVDSDLGLDFVSKVRPVKFNTIYGSNNKYGFIAQEVETVLTSLGKTIDDFDGINYVGIDPETSVSVDRYNLRYLQFIAPAYKAIQELKSQISILQTKVSVLENN